MAGKFCSDENSYISSIRQLLIDELKGYEGKPIKLWLNNISGIDGLESIIFKDYLDEEGKRVRVIALDRDTLEKIDLSNVSFKDVSIMGAYFFGLTGVTINPQEVYGKNLSGCNFDGVLFTGSFNDCIISHSNFKGSKGAYINPNGKDLNGCVFSDVTFTDSIRESIVGYCDFAGSKGAYIEPAGKRFKGCFFKDATIADNWFDCAFIDCHFKGSDAKVTRAVKVNMDSSKLNDVVFDSNMSENILDCNIERCDFTGSHGAVVSLDTFTKKSALGSTFAGVSFVGSFDGWNIIGANFTGSRGARIDLEKVLDKNVSASDLTDAYFGEVGDEVKTEFTSCEGMSLEDYLSSKDKKSVYVKVKNAIRHAIEK